MFEFLAYVFVTVVAVQQHLFAHFCTNNLIFVFIQLLLGTELQLSSAIANLGYVMLLLLLLMMMTMILMTMMMQVRSLVVQWLNYPLTIGQDSSILVLTPSLMPSGRTWLKLLQSSRKVSPYTWAHTSHFMYVCMYVCM